MITPADQWAFAALFPIHDDPDLPLSEAGPLLIRVELGVERGEVGVSVAGPTLGNFIATEKIALSGGLTTLELTLDSPQVGCWLVVRNYAPGGAASQATIHSIRTFRAPLTPKDRFEDVQLSEFVPFATLAPESQPPTRTDGEVWFDVGAHLGEKTLSFAAQNPGARVYAFEPNLKDRKSVV
jgi:hypothetical protein